MKKIFSAVLAFLLFTCCTGMEALAIQEVPASLKPAANARKIELAFVFDGPSDKNAEVLKTFQKTITVSLLPDYVASFPNDLIFTGDWTEKGAANASDKALKSRATTVISLGYMSSTYLENKQNKNKFCVTIDDYGLRDMGSNAFFNPVKQYVNDFVMFKKLVPTQHKTAILFNDNYYKTQKDWNGIIKKKFAEKNLDLDFVVLPVGSKNLASDLAKIPQDVDSVYVTPLFNLSVEQRKEVFNYLNGRKLPSFSSLGKEDVQLGALLGTSTPDADRKLAEFTSFNIHGYLHGNAPKNDKIAFYDDKVIFFNKDTAAAVGYMPHLRLLSSCEIITNKPVTVYDLEYVFNTLDEQNLDIKQKKFLVDAARRSTTAAYLKYLPTLRIDLGHQNYNNEFARSYADVPARAGQAVVGLDQVLFSPDLVTNIIVKHKKLTFQKAEKVATEQNLGLEIGFLYLDTLMLENMLKVQEEQLKQTRENLAIARVREKAGLCGREEALRWAGRVSEEEKAVLGMQAELKNVKIHINKLLNKDQREEFTFAPLTADDPAFFSSDLHLIDHVMTPVKLATFEEMLIKQAVYMAPETAKLRAAIGMKKAEIANYSQKFFLPNAKLTVEHGTYFDRQLPYEDAGHNQMKYVGAGFAGAFGGAGPALAQYKSQPYLDLDKNYNRIMVVAQWKPIEGGQKFAEIARCKAELNQLNAYLEEVNTEIERNIREVINRAIAKYFMIEKSYKSMFAEAENYQLVKAKYLEGKAPITQVTDAQHLYLKAKVEALNSQYEFFKELLWVQRGLVSVNWTKASPEAKKWIKSIPEILPADKDFSL